MRKIAIYCRVSTDEQARNKEGSITSQIQRLKLRVEEKNRSANKKWGKIVKIYKDEAYSGKNTDRPEFLQMLNDVRCKKIDTVMVTELSRLSRSVTDFLNFVKELEDYKSDFICLQYDFDTTSPAGKVFMTIIMALAQFERELTAERIKNNFHARALRGLSNGGTPFLGYDREATQSGKLVINPEEALIVKEVFQLYLESGGLAETANHLNAKGIKTKTWTSKTGNLCGGKKFEYNNIWRMLTNYSYIGKKEVNKINKYAEQDSLAPSEKYSLVDASWKPIIDETLFAKVQDKLKVNAKPKYTANRDFILTGLLVCDECGGPLVGKTGTGRNRQYFYYGHVKQTHCCIQNYGAELLEKQVKKKLFALVQNDAMKKQFTDAILAQSAERPQLNKKLLENKKKEIEALSSQTKKLVDLVANNPEASGVRPLLERINENEVSLEKYKLEKEELEETLLLESEGKITDAHFVLDKIDYMRKNNFHKFTAGRKKAILREIIKSIHVHPENMLRMDFWGSELNSEAQRKESKRPGMVLPYQKLGLPLEASFRKYPSKNDQFAPIKKAVGLGTYVLLNAGVLSGKTPVLDEGSPALPDGGPWSMNLELRF